MIKFLDKALIAGQWFDRGMLAEFDAKTEAHLIAEGDAVAYTVEVAGTIEHALTADHATTATSATTATTATNALTANSASTASTAANATNATSAEYATTAGTAANATSATNADHATTADTASTASHATTASTASNATTADSATTAASADFAATAAAADNITVHPYYHFHGFAGDQTAGDGRFFDISGINHGQRGANLSDAQMFTTAGYVSTVDPAVGTEDSTIHIPNLNFDYAGGEKLIVWWLGSGNPEGADAIVMGDGYGTAEGQRGWRLRMKTDGKFDLALWGATQSNSGSSHAAIFDGTLHSLAFAFDGSATKHGMWCDEIHHPTFGSALSSFGSGVAFDTRNSNTVNIGASRPASAASGSAGDGAAIKTRALVIIRLPSSYTMPTVAAMTSLFQQLRATPGKLILANAL